jgi:protein involved in polysaccharide export with SLBB domain
MRSIADVNRNDEFTVTPSAAVCVASVPVAVTVADVVPAVAVGDAVNVSVDDWPEVIDAGLKEAVTPLGSPVAASVIDCAAPFVIVVATVDVPVAP